MHPFATLIARRRERLASVEELLSDPDLFDDRARAEELLREQRQLARLMELWEEQQEMQAALEAARSLINPSDPSPEAAELSELAEAELSELSPKAEALELELQYALLPRDPSEDRDALLELRAGTGGDEASLFAAALLALYQRYAESRGWRFEILDANPTDVGGFKEVTARVTGQGVFRFLKHESGVHRVQRVPSTETQGRVHTSTATVAVLPEAEEVDVQIHPDDLRIETCRSGGAGGQHVNRTESAVQIFHLPSGIMVRCEKERSQLKNRETGMRILRARLFELKQREAQQKYADARRAQIGSGGREEKIRTYSFPQNRITDHRIGYTAYNLEAVMQGDLEALMAQLQLAEMQQRMQDLN